jgi:hypothetical protein
MSDIKLKVIGSNEVFPWELGEVISASSIKHLEDSFHEIIINQKKYIAEIKKFGINNNQIFFNCFLTDNESVGTMGFEITFINE